MAAQSVFAESILQADHWSLQVSPTLFSDRPAKHPSIVAFNSTLLTTHLNPQAPSLQLDSNLLFLVSSVPALVAFCVILGRAFEYLPYRPKWLRRFVDERVDGPKLPDNDIQRSKPNLIIWLLISTLLGLVTQIVLLFVPVQDLTALPRVLTWVSRVK